MRFKQKARKRTFTGFKNISSKKKETIKGSKFTHKERDY